VGRVLTAAGLIFALFLGYEFLLTGLNHDRTQLALLAEFRQQVPTTTLDAPTSPLSEGSPVALVGIPRLGLDQVAVEGTTSEDLKSGPGHLRSSPVPGEFVNAVLVGRRTTYGAPFRELDRLQPGDRISVTTGQGSVSYAVSEVRQVHAGDADPITATADSRLTLVTSDPPFFASSRLAVVAQLRGDPLAVAHRPAVSAGAGDLGLAGDPAGIGLAVLWAVLLAGVIWLGRQLRNRWPASVTYMLITPVGMVLALLAFSCLDRILPGTL
jgi:sortase A